MDRVDINALRRFLHRLFPGRCALCGRATHRHIDLCGGCETTLPRLSAPCRRCASPEVSAPARDCGFCLGRDWPFARCVAPFAYAAPVDRLVAGFKYRAELADGRSLSLLLAEQLQADYRGAPWPELLVPVPLHTGRLRQRGFNQAMEISRVLRAELGIPVDARSCRRRRDTGRQVGRSAAQRHQVLRAAFALRLSQRAQACRRVALVDDVLTSGATAMELGRAWRRASPGVELHLWCLARA